MTEYYSSGMPVSEISPEEQERIRRIKESIDKMESQNFLRENNCNSPEDISLSCREKLNSAQKLAITTIEGPLLVIAGAGSGKTHTLTNRVAFMLEKGIPAHKILLLTFTKKAAMEMKNRVCKIIPKNHSFDFTAGTFHSFANLMMRQYSKIIGIPASFSIIDTTDSKDLIGMILKKKNFTSSVLPRKNTIAKYISRARNFEKSVGDVIKEERPSLENCLYELEETALEYEKYKRANNLMDYDDLLEIFLDQLKTNQLFLEKIRQRFSFVLVDEYQDTNICQKKILNIMTSEHRNIMVVGDDCQSIYGFRGACVENILLFHEDWHDAKLVKLEQNYRSTQEILDFTNAIVSSSVTGYKKKLFSEHKRGEIPEIKTFDSPEKEAEYIADKINSSEKKYGMKNIAVLYRSSYHGNFIQAELLKQRISFVTRGGLKFNERMHVKDCMAYLRAASNPCDQISWSRILRLVSGVGNVTTTKILSRIHSDPKNPDISAFKNRKFYKKLSETISLVKSLSENRNNPQKLLDTVYEHYFP
ncbi:MAG: UvrD-helicase domain-containing protein, partial [bacterium]